MKSALLLVPVLFAIVLAPLAGAEEVVLAGGARYDARDVVVADGVSGAEGTVRFTYVVAGGTATLDLPWSRVDSWSLLALKSARVAPDDARAALDLARLAASRGLVAEAERRFRRAAVLDPSLADERDAGLRALADAALLRRLEQAERDLNRGRSDLALATATDVLGKAAGDGAAAGRARALVDLSTRVLETDRVRRAAEEAARATALAAAERAAFESALSRADTAIRAALADRTKAGDPAVGASRALTLLEGAEARLRDGRRLLLTARATAGDRVAEVDGRDGEVKGLLVATDLDLADLHRLSRRFDRARDFLRAAQILDPDNPRIRELRDLIERDLQAPPPLEPWPDPFVSGFSTGTYYGGRWYGGLADPCPCPPVHVRPRAYVTPGFTSGSFGSGFRWRFRW